jgi:hypothetical protein
MERPQDDGKDHKTQWGAYRLEPGENGGVAVRSQCYSHFMLSGVQGLTTEWVIR